MRKMYNAFLNNKNKIQNVLIVILCITIIFEVQELWFVNLANGQPLFQREKNSSFDASLKIEFLSPFRILNSVGNNEFLVSYEGEAFLDIKNLSQKILLEAVSKGSFIEQDKINEQILNNKNIIILEYTNKLDGKILSEALSTNKNTFSKVNEFDKICYIPYDSIIDILFLNSDTFEYSLIRVTNNNLKNELTINCNEIYSDGIYSYVTYDNNITHKGELILDNTTSDLFYYSIFSENPYATVYGDSPRNLVQSKIEKYFKSDPNFSTSESAYVFSDTDTVVKYFDNGTLEYAYYNVPYTKNKPLITESFAVAKKFIDEDEDVINSYYLKSYSKNSFESEIIFEFGYIINNYPIGFADETEMSTISVSVKNNTVTNYRKNVKNYYVSDDVKVVSKPFDSAISLLSSGNESNPFISNVLLAYKPTQTEDVELYWFMDAFDSGISLSTK